VQLKILCSGIASSSQAAPEFTTQNCAAEETIIYRIGWVDSKKIGMDSRETV
jgi:hypothetical protein